MKSILKQMKCTVFVFHYDKSRGLLHALFNIKLLLYWQYNFLGLFIPTLLVLLFSVKIGYLKEGNVLFNDALNTFYLRLYVVRHGKVLHR